VLTAFEVYEGAVWQQIWDSTPAAAQIKILQPLIFTLAAGEVGSLFAMVD